MLATDYVEIVSSEPIPPEPIIVNWSALVIQAHGAMTQYLVQKHSTQTPVSVSAAPTTQPFLSPAERLIPATKIEQLLISNMYFYLSNSKELKSVNNETQIIPNPFKILMSLLALFRLSADTEALAQLRHAIAYACVSGESQAGVPPLFSQTALSQYQWANQNPEQIMLALLEAELAEKNKALSGFLQETSLSSLDDVPMLVAHIQRNLNRELNQPEQIETLFTPPTVGDAQRLVNVAKTAIVAYRELSTHDDTGKLRADRLDMILEWFQPTVPSDTPSIELQAVLVALLAVFESSQRLRTQLAIKWLVAHTLKPIFLPSALPEAQKISSSPEKQAQFLLERALAEYSHSQEETLQLRICVNRAKTTLLIDPIEIIVPSDLQLGSIPRIVVINNHSALIIAIRETLQDYRTTHQVFADAFSNYLDFCYTNDQETPETFVLKEEAAFLALLLAIVQKPGFSKSSAALSAARTDLASRIQCKLLKEEEIIRNGTTIRTLISPFFSDASLNIVPTMPGFTLLMNNQPTRSSEASVTVGFWYLLQLLLKQYPDTAQQAILRASDYTRKQLLTATQTPQASDLGIARKTLQQFETYTDDDQPHAVPISTKPAAPPKLSKHAIIKNPDKLLLEIISATNLYNPKPTSRHGSEGENRKKNVFQIALAIHSSKNMTPEQKKDACCILLLAIVGTSTNVRSGQDGFLARLVAKNLIEIAWKPLQLNPISTVFLEDFYPELSTEPAILQSDTDKYCLVALRLLLQRLLQSYEPSEKAWIQKHAETMYQRLRAPTSESYVPEPKDFSIQIKSEERVIQDTTPLFTIIMAATDKYHTTGWGHGATGQNRCNQTRRIVDNIRNHGGDNKPATHEAALVLILSIVGELNNLHSDNSGRLARLVANEFFNAPTKLSTTISLKPGVFLASIWHEIEYNPLWIASSPADKPLTAIRLLAQCAVEQYDPDEQTILRQRVQTTRQNLTDSSVYALQISALKIGRAAVALAEERTQRDRSSSFLGFVFGKNKEPVDHQVNEATDNLTTRQRGQSVKQDLRKR